MRADQLAAVLKISGGKDEQVNCLLSRPSPNTQEYLSAHGVVGPHPPLVSCVMVTRGIVPILRHSVECFCRQTYPNRELVVVYDGEQEGIEAFFRSMQLPKVTLVSVPSVFSLGELRNIGIARASGQIIAQWDDDDLFDPLRLSLCVRTLLESGTAAVFLGSWLLWWPARA